MNCKNSVNTEKFWMLNEDQKFINQVLEKYGLEIRWLADKLNMDYEIVRYQLREAKNYRQDFHERVKEVLKKEGLISSNNEVCEKLKDELLDFNTIMNRTVALITKSIKEKIADKRLTDNEKLQLKKELRQQLQQITDEFNDLLLTIDMN